MHGGIKSLTFFFSLIVLEYKKSTFKDIITRKDHWIRIYCFQSSKVFQWKLFIKDCFYLLKYNVVQNIYPVRL